MWLLQWLPDFVVHLILLVGIAGIVLSYFVKFIPILANYRIPIQLSGFVLAILGVWLEGGIAKELEFRQQIEAANARAQIAEEKAAAATAQVKYVFLDKVKTVKDVQVIVQERIRDVSVKIDENCKVIPDVVDIHNQSAKNVKGNKK